MHVPSLSSRATILPLVTLALLPSACHSPAGESAETANTAARTFRFVYRSETGDLPAGTGKAELWIPIPLDSSDQRITDSTIVLRAEGHAPIIYTATGVPPDGTTATAALADTTVRFAVHPLGGGGGQSAYFASEGVPFEVELSFDVRRKITGTPCSASAEELAAALESDRMIPFGGKVQVQAASMKVPADPLAAGRVLFDHTLKRMRYLKPAGEPWGRGDAEWACDSRFGNCTDFHSYFIGLARAKGIPARFEMGFSVPGGEDPVLPIGGYHCWASFWTGSSWRAVDISEADKHPERADSYFGSLDPNRVTMNRGRDLNLTPTPAAGPLNFFIYPHLELDGVVSTATRSFKRINL